MMEIEETEKIVISKPVACRPSFCSKLKSFSAVLSGAVNASPPADFSETPAAVMKPMTLRFRPMCNSNPVGAETVSSAVSHPSEEVPESKAVYNVVYKPLAKLVSKSTIAFLANLGGHSTTPTREITDIVNPIQRSNHVDEEDFPVQPEKNADKSHPSIGDRTSHDGHNWRKYGQKQAKGSEYMRSYYKCTYPNCPVKKKVEKTLDFQIAEIVYNGEHSHSMPQTVVHDGATRNEVMRNPSSTDREVYRGKCDEGGLENRVIIEPAGRVNFSVEVSKINDPVTIGTSNSSVGVSEECDEVSESLEAGDGEFKSKRMKIQNQLSKECNTVGVGVGSSEPRIIIQNNTDPEIIGDGFRWRKYGQKIVKGKIFPRSYYRCTSPKCDVRKYVEKLSEDPGNVITTYEGRHNHNMPIKSTNTRNKKKS